MRPQTKPVPPDKPGKGQICLGCGLTTDELYNNGQMGCARCYETFAGEVERALMEIHGESRHIGKNSP